MNVDAPKVGGGVRNLLRRQAAVIYGMTGRLWLALTGPVTIIFLTASFTPDAQGYFVTFMHLAAARAIGELGLGQVIIVKMAHLYSSSTKGDDAVGERVAGLIRFTAKWFAGAGFVVGALLCVGGTALLKVGNGMPTAEWLLPWVVLSWLVGIDVALSSLLFPLEGARLVESVYFCRKMRNFINSLALWLSFLLGFQLWSISVALFCSLIWTAWFIAFRGSLIVAALRSDATVAKINWFSEVFPAQWRLALSSFAEYVSVYTVVPLMFVTHGPVIAGQLGVTWQLALAVSSIAGAIVSTRFPQFSRLAAAGSTRELDSLFLSTCLISMAICLVGALGAGFVVLFLQESHLSIASRLLPFNDVALFLCGILIWHFNLAIIAYLRAHGGDPYLPASLTGATLMVVVNVTLGRWFGPAGLLWGYAITGACVMVPFSFYLLQRKRRERRYPPL